MGNKNVCMFLMTSQNILLCYLEFCIQTTALEVLCICLNGYQKNRKQTNILMRNFSKIMQDEIIF